jgi:tetratricopeptide (TPR) repeat protein
MERWTSSPLAGPVPKTAFEQAAALHVGGNLAAAEQIYRAILKQRPDDFAALYNLAVALIATLRCDEAVRLLRKALNRNPKSAIANVALARAYQELRRDEDAVERARRAVARDAGSHAAHDTLATGLAVLGNTMKPCGPRRVRSNWRQTGRSITTTWVRWPSGNRTIRASQRLRRWRKGRKRCWRTTSGSRRCV